MAYISNTLRTKSKLFQYVNDDATFTFDPVQRTGIKKIAGGSYTNGGMITKVAMDQDPGNFFEIGTKFTGGTTSISTPIVMRQQAALDYTDGYGVMFSASDCSTVSPASGGQVIIPTALFDHWYLFTFKFRDVSTLDIYLNGNLIYTYTDVPIADDGWYFCLGGSYYEVLTVHYRNFRAKV